MNWRISFIYIYAREWGREAGPERSFNLSPGNWMGWGNWMPAAVKIVIFGLAHGAVVAGLRVTEIGSLSQ